MPHDLHTKSYDCVRDFHGLSMMAWPLLGESYRLSFLQIWLVVAKRWLCVVHLEPLIPRGVGKFLDAVARAQVLLDSPTKSRWALCHARNDSILGETFVKHYVCKKKSWLNFRMAWIALAHGWIFLFCKHTRRWPRLRKMSQLRICKRLYLYLTNDIVSVYVKIVTKISCFA